MELPYSIEAILFVRGEPVSFKELGKLLEIPESEAKHHARTLAESLEQTGLSVVLTAESAELRSAGEASELIEKMQKEERAGPLGKASLETLAILLYRGPSTRSEIEYIRGVQVSATLRLLLMRGLVERVAHPTDNRSILYKPTTEVLAHLGVTRAEELPDYEALTKELVALEETMKEKEHHEG